MDAIDIRERPDLPLHQLRGVVVATVPVGDLGRDTCMCVNAYVYIHIHIYTYTHVHLDIPCTISLAGVPVGDLGRGTHRVRMKCNGMQRMPGGAKASGGPFSLSPGINSKI